jgi:hypothetical protein
MGQANYRELVRRGFLCTFSLVPQQDDTPLYSRRLTITSLVEAMPRIAVRREDGDFMATRLETDGGIDDQSLSTANTQVRVEENDTLLLCHC